MTLENVDKIYDMVLSIPRQKRTGTKPHQDKNASRQKRTKKTTHLDYHYLSNREILGIEDVNEIYKYDKTDRVNPGVNQYLSQRVNSGICKQH